MTKPVHSDSVNLGSNPSPPAKPNGSHQGISALFARAKRTWGNNGTPQNPPRDVPKLSLYTGPVYSRDFDEAEREERRERLMVLGAVTVAFIAVTAIAVFVGG